MDQNGGKREPRFYESLPKLIDLIDNCLKEFDQTGKNYQKRIDDLNMVMNQIKELVDKKSFVKFDPASRLEDMKNEAIMRNDKKFLQSYYHIKTTRQLFYSNQEIRDANIASKFQSTALSEINYSEKSAQIDNILENQKKLSKSPALNTLVDSNLKPIYSTYFHLYEPHYFPSTHKSINSYYISSLLPTIIKSNKTNSISAYKSELSSTKDMLDYLIKYFIDARTEYEFFEIQRKYPNPKIITNNPAYLQKKEELDNVIKSFKSMVNNYDIQFKNLKNVFHQELIKMDDYRKRLSEERKKLGTLHKEVETVRSDYTLFKYFDQVFKSQQVNPKPAAGSIQPSLTSLFQPLFEWSTLKDIVLDTITSDSPTLHSLENCIEELNAYDKKLSNAIDHLRDKVRSKEEELSRTRAQLQQKNASIDPEILRKIDEAQMKIDQVGNGAFEENMKRLKERNSIEKEFEWDVSSISRIIERNPLIELIEPMINLADPANLDNDDSEIQRRLDEIKLLESIKKERDDEFEADKKIIEESESQRKEVEKVRKEKAKKSLNGQACDEKYTEDRMFLTCWNCEAMSEFLVKPCKHTICKKCYEKSKKKRISYCPYCEKVVDKFIKLNW